MRTLLLFLGLLGIVWAGATGGIKARPAPVAVATTTTPPGPCTTCDALGDCLPAPLVINSQCTINPSDCPIPSCPAYCAAVSSDTPTGHCDATSHVCVCTSASPAPPVPTPVPCTAFNCENSGLVCIPDNYKDPCTHASIGVDSCPFQLPSCNAQCSTHDGSTCSADGKHCLCGGVGATVTAPSPKKPSVRTATAVHATTAAAAAVVVIANVTSWNSNGTITYGKGAISGYTIMGSVALIMVIMTIAVFVHQAYTGDKLVGKVPEHSIPLRAVNDRAINV